MNRIPFHQAEREFSLLKTRLATDRITPKEFEIALAKLAVRDEFDRAWRIDARTGAWQMDQSDARVSADPNSPPPSPARPLAAPTPGTSSAKTVTHLLPAIASSGLVLLCVCAVGIFALLGIPVVNAGPIEPGHAALTTSAAGESGNLPAPVSHAAFQNISMQPGATETAVPLGITTTTPASKGSITIPTPGPTSDLPQTYVSFNADFSTAPCPLFEGDNETRKYGCELFEYDMLHKLATTRYSYLEDVYADAIVQATGYFVKGSGKYEYGIVFRANADGSTYYVFTVTNDGKYNVALYQNEKYTDLIPYTVSPLVKTGANQENTLQVVMRGNRFDFYLNDTFLDTVTDNTIADGVVGLFFYNDTPGVEVAFDQFTISTFSPPPTVTTEPTTAALATPAPKGTISAPTPGPTSELPQTYVDFDADFFADTCPLFEGDNETRKYACDLFEYSMLHKQATTRYAFYDAVYADAVVEATGYFVKGSGKYEYGIVFRANTDGSEYYVFTVTNDGRYNVSLYQNDKYTDLIPYTASPLVKTGADASNTFKVVMRGNRFAFYLNDTFLDTVTDDAIADGVVGLFFYNDTPGVEVAFDQLTISTFSPPPTVTTEPTTAALATPAPKGTISAPTPGPTSELPQTYVDFDADFFADTCPLFEGDNETRKYACDLFEYSMLHKQATTRYAFYDAVYADAVVEATGYFVKGSGKYEYGIVFRANTDGSEYYVFTVTNDGKYNVALYQNSKYTDLIPYTASPLVKTGADASNTFKVILSGNRFAFYLNDTFLDTVTDDAIADGVVGLFFYNDTPGVEVAFDQLTISTFSPPPTVTAESTPTALETAAPTAAPTGAPKTPTVAVKPGLYITGLRFTPAAPKRGQPITFFAKFLNTTGREQNYKWLVEIWEADTNKKNPFGQADHREQLIPTGTNERATGDSFKVGPGGPCAPFRAHVVFIDDQGRRVPFLRTNGTELWVPFQVCP